MNKNIIKSLACAIAATSSVAAMAYDTSVLNTGDRTTEMHMSMVDSSVLAGPSSSGLEIQQIYTVINASAGIGAAALDSYSKAVGGPETAYELTLARSWVPAFGVELPNGSGSIPSAYEISTDVNGKIIGDSWSVSITVNPSTSADVWTFTDYQTRSFVAFEVCSSGDPVIADARAVANSGGASGVPAGCSFAALGHLAYLTCDITEECGQLNKSVPVPAIASGVLALGLVGITLLTSRRRAIK